MVNHGNLQNIKLKYKKLLVNNGEILKLLKEEDSTRRKLVEIIK